MARIDNVSLSIDRSTHTAGSVCSINYSYVLHADNAEIAASMGFSVWVEVWGKELLGDRLLGDGAFDTHTVDAAHLQRVSRHFLLPCAAMNDRIGRDVIYICVKARSTIGVEIEQESKPVKANF